MLDVLIESSAHPRASRAPWTLASVVAHAALIGAAVILTMQRTVAPEIVPERAPPVYFPDPSPPTSLPQTLRQEQGVHTMPVLPRLELPSIQTAEIQVEPERIVPSELFAPNPGRLTSATDPGSVGPGGVYTESRVDRAVMSKGGNGQPQYPTSLRTANLGGEVLVRFIVDTAGRVEPSSVSILQATHDLFGDAVRRWLQRTRYVPAEADGHPVRQLVEQRIEFTLR